MHPVSPFFSNIFITGFLIRATLRMSLVKQELHTLPEHMRIRTLVSSNFSYSMICTFTVYTESNLKFTNTFIISILTCISVVKHFSLALVFVIVWQLDLQLPVKSVPITTKVVGSIPVYGEVYSIQHYVIKLVTSDRPVVSPGTPVSSTNKADLNDIYC